MLRLGGRNVSKLFLGGRAIANAYLGNRLVWQSTKPLPYDYEVEYLEAAGDQWIDTGVIGNQNLTIDAYFSYRDSTATGAVFGSRVSHLSRALAMTSYDGSATNNLYLNYNTSSEYLLYRGNDVYAHSWSVHVQNGNSRLYKDGTVVSTKTTAVGQFTTPSTLLVLAMYNNGKIAKTNGIRVHSFRIESSVESERRDLIPVRKGSKGYMYDRISGKLFGNKGTGYFVVGPDIVEVEYLESTGTQWIDTGIYLTNNHSVEIDFQLTTLSQSRAGLFGGYSTSRYGALVSQSNQKLEFGYGSSNVYYQIDTDTSRHLARQQKNNLYVDGALINTFSEATFTSNYSAPLGNFNFTNYNPALAKYYSSRWYDGDTLVRDFVPVRVGMEGAMMDRLTRRIYRNAGTGSFNYA